MSMPKIPDIEPKINFKLEDSINLVIASIGFEELGLAHLINAEGEKIQSFLGTLDGQESKKEIKIEDLEKLDNLVNETLDSIIKKEFVLLMKLRLCK
jgi:ribosome maturation factor RimP